MALDRTSSWVGPAAVILVTACSHHVYSPPARGPTLRTVHTLQPGSTAVQVNAHAQSALFDPDVYGGSLGVRHGLSREIEVGVDATFLHLSGQSGAKVDRSIYATRVEGRFNPRRNRFFTLFGGVGGGYAPAGGGFLSADAGVTFAFENCYLIPFTSAGGFLSVPVDPRSVDTRIGVDDEPKLSKAQTTVGVQHSFGVRIPLGGYDRCPQTPSPVALTVAYGLTYLQDFDEDELMMGGSAGIEVRF